MSKTEFLGLEAQSGNDLLQLNSGVGVNMQLIDEYAKQTSAKIGDTSTLQTTYKDSIVGALNEVINTIPDLGGTNLLNATNELVTIGASASWLGRTWRYAKSGATPNATGTQAVFAVSDAPNPQIKYGFEIHNDSGRRFVAQDNIPLVTGATYTLSCYARATAGSPKLILQTGSAAGGFNTSVVEITDSWKKYTMTFAARADAESAYFGCDGTDATLQICGEKLETGDYATDWSYSPNDIDARNAQKLDKSKVVNGLLTTEEGFALDARQGKALDEKIAELNSKLSGVLTLASGVKNASSTNTSFMYKRGHKVCLFLDITATFSGENNIYATLPVGFRPSRIIRFSGTAGTSYWNASHVVSFMVYPDTGYVTGVCSSATSNTKYARGYIEFDID